MATSAEVIARACAAGYSKLESVHRRRIVLGDFPSAIPLPWACRASLSVRKTLKRYVEPSKRIRRRKSPSAFGGQFVEANGTKYQALVPRVREAFTAGTWDATGLLLTISIVCAR